MAHYKLCYLFILSYVYYTIQHSESQQCISSPADLVWTLNNGIYSATLTFGAKEFTINGVTFKTRVHNGMLPSPTLRMAAGNTYKLTLMNELGMEPPNPTPNIIKEVNYTNIHTHGLHISGESPADNIFDVVNPTNQHEYTYHIVCDHSGGTMWWHPHHHGSTAIQVGGGAAGALIVEDNEHELASFPDWYKQLSSEELILVIQHLDLAKMAQLAGSVDKLFKTSSNTALYVINGIYEPTICLQTGRWRKLRIVHVDIASSVTLTVDGTASDSCQIYLLAKDGVLISGQNNETPRLIDGNQMYFTVASRADIAIQCSAAGEYELIAAGTTIAFIDVIGDDVTPQQLTVFNPLRPPYLQSLLNKGAYASQQIRMSARTINGEQFKGETSYLFSMEAGTVNEWSISAKAHPFHAHVNHFQLMSIGNSGHAAGWTQVGDWIDTLDFNADVRFVTDRFGGKVILHCHILEHEDQGAMSVVEIHGGCDGDKGNYDTGSEAICDWTCESPSTTESPIVSTTESTIVVESITTASPTRRGGPPPKIGGIVPVLNDNNYNNNNNDNNTRMVIMLSGITTICINGIFIAIFCLKKNYCKDKYQPVKPIDDERANI